MASRIRIGAERAAAGSTAIAGNRIGLLTNFTGTMPDLSRNIDALLAGGVPLHHLFGPEHGLDGAVQAGESSVIERDERSGLRFSDTYLSEGEQLDQMIVDAGVDALAFDMQDIGVRFYTYIWTMYDAMRSAARLGLPFTVLDRPNPLGGAVLAGPGVSEKRFTSFVGRSDIHQRHGLTAGELARLFASRDLADDGLHLDLHVVELEDWDATKDWTATGLPWVPPSPNIPTLDSVYAFSGTGLVEGTTLSEGRGTTRPFETIGAPFLTAAFAEDLRSRDLPGVLFRDVAFQPTFHKHAGETARGIQLHITDHAVYDSVGTALAILEAAKASAPESVRSLNAGERLDPGDSGYALDRLWGSTALRDAINGDSAFAALDHTPRRVTDVYGEDVLLYPR
ncbi:MULTISPECIES: exo-beta-N-acetylmuramidase NamZ family protein [unclassified Microbacterium]|uniref:exo-beta-N-acetylmuramidase NamZ family protein n=1 Tax=unclassified Microbacterium TaxID=2609290 RepID=UPI0030196C07